VARVGLGVESKLTSTGQIFGTAMYLAPECINAQLVTPALDVYQMGLILVELLTGRPVVNEESHLKCVVVHASGQFTLPAELMACPLGRVLERALAFDPNARFKDGYAFADALKAIDPHTVPTVIAGESVRTVAVSVGLDAGGAYMPTEPHTGPFTTGGLTTPMASGDHLRPSAVSVHLSARGHAVPSAVPMLSPPSISQPIDTRPPRPAWLFPALGVGALMLLLLIGVPVGLSVLGGEDATEHPAPAVAPAPAPAVLVMVSSDPVGATVYDGEEELGQPPLHITFDGEDADARELRVTLAGFETRTVTVAPTDADAGVTVTLEQVAPPVEATEPSDDSTPPATRPKSKPAPRPSSGRVSPLPPSSAPAHTTPPQVKPKPPTVLIAD